MSETQARAGTSPLVPLLAGAAVAISLGVYGRVHDPGGKALYTLFFTDTIHLKVWFATAAFTLGVLQVFTALRMYGKINFPRRTPSWFGDFHRLTGTLAFLFTLPVAFHCLWALGFEKDTGETRRFIHSLLGCLFYGAFVVKVTAVRSHKLPGWFLPLAGGSLFAVLTGLWLTSSLWFFQNVGGGL